MDVPEVDALRNAQPVDMMEMDEAQEAAYIAKLGQAQEALNDVQGITEGRPLTQVDVGQFARVDRHRKPKRRTHIASLAQRLLRDICIPVRDK